MLQQSKFNCQERVIVSKKIKLNSLEWPSKYEPLKNTSENYNGSG